MTCGACRHGALTRIVSDTMTRGIVLVFLALLAGACTPPRPDPATVAAERAAAEAWQAANYESMVRTWAGYLQLLPFADPAVHANPWPCARAVAAAEHAGDILPPCLADALRREQAATVTAVPVFVIGR
jgi:hypothetical protein